MQRQQRQRQSAERRHEHHRELGRVARQQVDERLANVVEDPATLADRGDDAREVVVGQDHVRRFAGHFRAGPSHRDPDVRFAQRRGIVDAVTRHRHDGAARLPLAHDPDLVLRRGSRMDDVVLDVAARHDAEFPRDGAGGQRMVAGDHHRRDAGGTRGGHRLDGLRSWRVGNANQADQRGALFGAGWRDGDREDAETALGHLRVGLRRVTRRLPRTAAARSRRRP